MLRQTILQRSRGEGCVGCGVTWGVCTRWWEMLSLPVCDQEARRVEMGRVTEEAQARGGQGLGQGE